MSGRKREFWHNEEGLLVQRCHGKCGDVKFVNVDFVKTHPTRPDPMCYDVVCKDCMKPIWIKRHKSLRALLREKGLTANYKKISKRINPHPWRMMNDKMSLSHSINFG